MYISIAVLADYANLSQEGKLNIMGIFDRVLAPNVPVIHPQMQLVTKIEFDPSEVATKDMKIVLMDADGKELFSISGELNLKREPEGRPTVVNQMLKLNNIVFPKYGDYEFKILINDDLKSSISLSVVSPPDQPPTS